MNINSAHPSQGAGDKRYRVVNDYFSALVEKFRTGQAREHAYRPAFEALMQSLDPSLGIINDPSRSEHGNPDFVFLRGDVMVGYAETKDIGINLDKTEKGEQLARYFGYSNLILTDYLEFRFFKNGSRSGEPITIGKQDEQTLHACPERFAELANALTDFVQGTPEPITSGKRLAEIMGGKARRIRDNVTIYLAKESETNAELLRVYETIKKLLVHDLSIEKFADMYAQTLVYGLFVARYNDDAQDGFSRQKARELVPASNPFLREFFDHIVGPRFDIRLRFIVDELCAVFSVSDMREIVHRHFKISIALFDVSQFDTALFDDAAHKPLGLNEKDPIIHFYEDFLQEYDPAERKKMGAYYTPIPVARFIVRAVDEALKRDFGLPKGLADTSKRQIDVVSQGKKAKLDVHRVQILDPAVGTATFLNEVVNHIHQNFAGQQGRWASYVETDLLPRLFGFELMMAPYTIAHLKLGMTLRETGCVKLNQRLGVYLTNTLEEGVNLDNTLFGFGLSQSIADEAISAGKIKNEKPIMVVIGNPPYSGESSNKTDFAMNIVAKYKFEPGGKTKLQERNPKWINDDYVKFIAFAEEMIERNGEGIVAMITNHGYLDNPTFRGMRWRLVTTFDEIHVLDLHGNAKKKETTPEGGKDENVFDIQQGVAIMIAVKTRKKKPSELARVYHADLYGRREEKFKCLEKNEQSWQEISLDERMFFFTRKSNEGRSEYEKGIAINKLFMESNVGVVTAADAVLVGNSVKEVLKNVERAKLSQTEGKICKRLAKHEIEPGNVKPIAYRPFDNRYIYYSTDVVERARYEVMQHFLKGENVGLIASHLNRQMSLGYFFMTRIVTDFHILDSAADSTSVFPLYLYHDDGTRTPNFDRDLLKTFTRNLKKPYETEEVLDYIYAVLHSPKYRETYKEFLKIDFPRVPAPTDDEQFFRLAKLGKQLRELHLLTSSRIDDFVTTYSKNGSNVVEKIERKETDIWINREQYFGRVPEVAWKFYIGGYQPAQKWLKDRKGTALSNEDIEHYQKMIVALTETERIMREIEI